MRLDLNWKGLVSQRELINCWRNGPKLIYRCDCIHAFLTYPAVPYDDLAVPDIFPSGTIGSPKNSITMNLICHFDRCLHFHDQSRRFLRGLWLCKVTARWPDLTHLSVHSLVNGVRSTRTSFLVRVIGSTATTVRKVSEVTKEMKLHDYA